MLFCLWFLVLGEENLLATFASVLSLVRLTGVSRLRLGARISYFLKKFKFCNIFLNHHEISLHLLPEEVAFSH